MSQYKYVTVIRDTEAEPTYKFAEVKYGKIVTIYEHWVPLNEFIKFFEANAMFIDITNVTIDGETPVIGDVVDGNKIIHVKSIYTPAEMLGYKIEQMKLIRDKKELEPIEYNEVLFDADETSLTRMTKARQVLEDTGMESILWTTYDNGHIELTVNDFKNINTLMAQRSTALHDRYNKIKTYLTNVLLTEDPEQLVIINHADWDMDLDKDAETLAEEYKAIDQAEFEKTEEYAAEEEAKKLAAEKENLDNSQNAFNITEVRTIDEVPEEYREEARALWGGDVNPAFLDKAENNDHVTNPEDIEESEKTTEED